MSDILIIVIVGTVLLLFALWWRRVYDFAVLSTLASISVNLRGPDPAHLLVPSLLVLGVLMGHLRFRMRFPPPLRALFLGFLLFYAISNILGDPVWEWVMVFGANTALFMLIKLYVTSEQKMRAFFFALLLGQVTTSLLALAGLRGWWTPPDDIFFPIYMDGFNIFHGTRNVAAWYTASLLIWLLDEMLEPKLWKGFWLVKVILIVLGIVQLAATLTRSAWIGFLIAVVAYLLLNGVKAARKGITVPGIMTIIIILIISWGMMLSTGYSLRIISEIEKGLLTTERLYMVQTRQALSLVPEHPFGLGTGRVGKLFAFWEGNVEFSLGAHNFMVQILSENGWGTFLAFAFIYAYLFFPAIPKAIRGESCYGVSYQTLVSGMTCMAVVGFFHDLVLWNTAWIFPSLAAAMLWPTSSSEASAASSELRRERVGRTDVYSHR